MRISHRFTLVLTVVILLASFTGVAQAVPPPPQPLYVFDGICFAWDGDTYTFVAGGQVVGYIWFYDVFVPVCPMGEENFDYSESVQGRFVDNTELLGAPDASQGTGVVMTIGKTVWVHGIDASASYFEISLGAAFAWVPVGSLEPNYEKPWNGAPLVVPVID
jgi:hypothetical protein